MWHTSKQAVGTQMLLQSKVNSKAWKIQTLNFLADASLLCSNISATAAVLGDKTHSNTLCTILASGWTACSFL